MCLRYCKPIIPFSAKLSHTLLEWDFTYFPLYAVNSDMLINAITKVGRHNPFFWLNTYYLEAKWIKYVSTSVSSFWRTFITILSGWLQHIYWWWFDIDTSLMHKIEALYSNQWGPTFWKYNINPINLSESSFQLFTYSQPPQYQYVESKSNKRDTPLYWKISRVTRMRTA